jgi:hypothetical protein
MAESTTSPESLTAPKRSRPIWLVVLIVLLVVCCCCAALSIPVAWFTGDSVLQSLVLSPFPAMAPWA